MKLVECLAAGVNGAANGTATFVLRGTASSAASVLYSDFEGTTQPGTNIITLDANGGAEVYTNAYCDVTLKTSAGATLRTITVGDSATNVEVISDSFTGTDYSGSPTAVSEPITLAAVLDKWNNSAGSTGIDWKVDVNGVGTNLSTAFASLAGLFFNVMDPAYGAVGDGVTDDTTAIGLAIAAASTAGGGIVFFPATANFYLFTTLTIAAANFTLMGAGPRASVLRTATTAADAITISDTTANSWKRFVNLGIQGTGANANELVSAAACPNLVFENVDFSSTTYTGAFFSRASTATSSLFTFKNCNLTVGASNTIVFENLCSSDNVAFFKLDNCRVFVPASFTGIIVFGPNFTVEGCIFDASAVTSGTYYHINPGSNATSGKYLGRCVGNTFIDGGSTGFAFLLISIATATDFYEEANTFVGFTAPTTLAGVGQIYSISHNAEDSYRCYLGSRKGRVLEVSNSSTGTLTPSAITSYEHLFVTHTGAGNIQLDLPLTTMVAGMDATIIVLNSSSAQRDIVLNVGESVQTYSNESGTSGNDITTQPNDTERSIFKMSYSHNGSGSPLVIVVTGLED